MAESSPFKFDEQSFLTKLETFEKEHGGKKGHNPYVQTQPLKDKFKAGVRTKELFDAASNLKPVVVTKPLAPTAPPTKA